MVGSVYYSDWMKPDVDLLFVNPGGSFRNDLAGEFCALAVGRHPATAGPR